MRKANSISIPCIMDWLWEYQLVRASATERGCSRGNYPEARKKLKLFCSVICCNDIKVKFRRGSVFISCPGAVLALGGPG